ncbi:hypothetical protein OPKNFCMD_4605 [Methylobacterium crusticola]|uniref:Uncharacterized protein n=1 Tax=Methylobacterium crusticola TaxID=1697972 RepID=A0ABQ4R4T3_9HYPH|nr:hypothetical protein [Methylobacterium crusticola]GJD51846.1 hypothetical protein OPKNFCMD_4605 [Methylobacterium crusticola]
MRHGGRLVGSLVGLALAGTALAADLPGPGHESGIRYFPRGDGDVARRGAPPWGGAACPPGRPLVPTNGPLDPTYVGSPYGLGKPSYYGFPPPLGVDDPYGRRLRACP